MKKFLLVCVAVCISNCLFAQNDSLLIGNWEGAFIQQNAFQKIDAQFYVKSDKIFSLQIMEEWHPAFGEFEIEVIRDSLGFYSMNTGLGKAKMELDTNNLELVGFVEDKLPGLYIHFKKVPTPPTLDSKIVPVTILNDTVNLSGHLHQPYLNRSKTAVILVGGRSCYAGSTKYDLYAKLLREYGIAVLAYNKRGTGKSSGDCSTATISDLASDVVAIKGYLISDSIGYDKIGLIGSSAGGWVSARAQELTDFDFIVSVVGPSTSVRMQQFQSMEYGIEEFKLSSKAKKDVATYTNMMFDAPATEESYKEFESLLKRSKKDGWDQLLDPTDIPDSVEGINDLWVRRHNYDPFSSLAAFTNPFLAIYGENDWIVPLNENIEQLEKAFQGNRSKYLEIVIAKGANHGTDVPDKLIELPNGFAYKHFFRIAPHVQIEIINFLRIHQFIN